MKSGASIWTIMGLAFLLRASLLIVTGPDPKLAFTPDSPSYVQPAQSLRKERLFATPVRTHLAPELYRTPGYPMYLTLFLAPDGNLRQRAVQWSQAVLGALSAGWVYWAALVLWKRREAAVIAGGGMALDFSNAIHCTFILTDILFVFVMSLILFTLVKRWYLIAGLLTASAAFVRPVGIYYAGFLTGLFILCRLGDPKDISWKQILIFAIASILPLQAWNARNYAVAGKWTFSTVQSANLYQVRAALVKMEEEKITYEKAVQDLTQSLPEADAARYLRRHWKGYARVAAKDVVKFLTGNSMKVAAWTILKDEAYNPATVPTHSSDSPMEQAKTLIHRHPVLGAGMILYLLFLALTYGACLIGLFQAWLSVGWRQTLILASSLIYFSALTLGVDAQARYRLPVMPALFVFAGGSVLLLLRKDPC